MKPGSTMHITLAYSAFVAWFIPWAIDVGQNAYSVNAHGVPLHWYWHMVWVQTDVVYNPGSTMCVGYSKINAPRNGN